MGLIQSSFFTCLHYNPLDRAVYIHVHVHVVYIHVLCDKCVYMYMYMYMYIHMYVKTVLCLTGWSRPLPVYANMKTIDSLVTKNTGTTYIVHVDQYRKVHIHVHVCGRLYALEGVCTASCDCV